MSSLEDPRVFFAAERTLLAWNRTSLTMMAFGFVIERFGLFVQLLQSEAGRRSLENLHRGTSYWVGLAFILLGAVTSLVAVVQFRRLLASLKPNEIPDRYVINMGVLTNLVVAVLGAGLLVYLFYTATW